MTPTAPLPAHRIDLADGTRHEAAFVGPAGERFLGFTHLPASGPASAGVVVCPSVHAEFLRTYRKEVLLARRLCRAGIAVQRFHYRGTGNSEGDPARLDFTTMQEDALAAAEHLTARSGAPRLAFVGTRLGALVAAASARSCGAGRPLALWEPALTGARYYREAFRARLVRELRHGAGERPNSDKLVAELRDTGTVDILGYLLTRALYDSTVELTLPDVVGEAARPLLVVQVAKRSELHPELDAFASQWRSRGCTVQTLIVQEEEAWWYVGEDWKPDEDRPETTALVHGTADWLIEQLRGAVADAGVQGAV